MGERVCQQCGVDISNMGQRAIFCSNACKKRSYRGAGHTATKQCRICWKEFCASGRSHRRVVCSDECWMVWDRRIHAHINEFAISLMGPIKPKICMFCGAAFITKNGRGRYCSKTCKLKMNWQKNGEVLLLKNREWQNAKTAAASALSLAHTLSQIKTGDISNGND